jgi:GNAT superfamily N-acetyltransferase
LIKTRKVTENDKEFLWNLKVAAMRPWVELVYGWNDDAQYSYFLKSFRPKTMRIIRYDGQDVGMVELLERPEELFIARFEVLPEFQNRGIGTTTIQWAIDQAVAAQKTLRLQVFKINSAQQPEDRLCTPCTMNLALPHEKDVVGDEVPDSCGRVPAFGSVISKLNQEPVFA